MRRHKSLENEQNLGPDTVPDARENGASESERLLQKEGEAGA